jgi:hypothetical protein
MPRPALWGPAARFPWRGDGFLERADEQSRDEARRITMNIAQLPDLLGMARRTAGLSDEWPLVFA